MIKNTISRYIIALFEDSRDGQLTVGDGDDRFEYEVDWDTQTAQALAQQCSELVAHLTELAGWYGKQFADTRQLSKAQQEVWNIYLRPFPEHDLDPVALKAVWEKEALGILPCKEERMLSREYNCWYEENALQRLPWKACPPTGLITRARRYARLVQLKAPIALQEHEARCLAEEYVLYYCMK